jgi:hypothetical protein
MRKKVQPPMNTDERGLKIRVLSALIGVHQRLEVDFSSLQSVTERRP